LKEDDFNVAFIHIRNIHLKCVMNAWMKGNVCY